MHTCKERCSTPVPPAAASQPQRWGLSSGSCTRATKSCIIDPEGDYESFGGAIVLGDATTIPTLDEIADVLDQPSRSAIVNLLGVSMHDRPALIGCVAFAAFCLPSRIRATALDRPR